MVDVTRCHALVRYRKVKRKQDGQAWQATDSLTDLRSVSVSTDPLEHFQSNQIHKNDKTPLEYVGQILEGVKE
jgi:hypothetical protein